MDLPDSHKLLVELLEKQSMRAVARTLSVEHGVVSRWRDKRARPEHQFRLALERIYGIPALGWLTDKERLVAFGAPQAEAVSEGEAAE